MQLDIRIPIGALFTMLGFILTGYGLLADPSVYARSLGENVNLVWGIVILLFGVVMLVLAGRHARRKARSPQGG